MIGGKIHVTLSEQTQKPTPWDHGWNGGTSPKRPQFECSILATIPYAPRRMEYLPTFTIHLSQK